MVYCWNHGLLSISLLCWTNCSGLKSFLAYVTSQMTNGVEFRNKKQSPQNSITKIKFNFHRNRAFFDAIGLACVKNAVHSHLTAKYVLPTAISDQEARFFYCSIWYAFLSQQEQREQYLSQFVLETFQATMMISVSFFKSCHKFYSKQRSSVSSKVE